MQLERLLRAQGFGSKADCRGLVRQGRVSVDGVVCDDPNADFSPAGFAFAVDGVSWRFRDKVYLAMNKPAHFECSHQPRHHPSIYTLLPQPLVTRDVQAVGRLDEDTTGLLLFTDDGQFNHNCISPKKKVPKVYDATVKHPLDSAQLEALLAGVVLNDEPEPIAAMACEIRSPHVLRLTVTEGKYHLVKRMIAAAGNRVEGLHRVAIGGFELPPALPLGHWMWLTAADLERIGVRGAAA
ncbi:16S rRNA pseudouridine(516) synthase [Propionivibrio limicola]|uniref:16S rRNA pseudouridine(516) synthase n=1 Tax=Propionivibrio limicola TaxID=167645 RepID=UPI00129274BF|nr:pseudouridine synthase [Propionivibrio limicola]